jgi:hypothetical protein
MHRHEMQQSNIYLGIYIIEYYFFWKNQGVTTVKMCKVQWSHHTEKEATWE